MPAVSPFRRWLEARGISQREIAARTGYSASQLSRWVSGARTPQARALHVIAEAFAATPDEILGRAMPAAQPLRGAPGLTAEENEILRQLALARETFGRLKPARSAEQVAEFSAAIEAAHAAVVVHKAARALLRQGAEGQANPEAWVGFV